MGNRVVRQIIRIGRRRGESRKHILAALATGRVESNFRNLHYGDADSQGWRQERRSLYRNPTNLRASINRFYNETDQLDRGQSAGQLAADVQRPAAQYRGRYSQVLASGEPRRLLRGLRLHPDASGDGRYVGDTPASVSIGRKTIFDKAGFEQASRRALLANFLQKSGHGNSILFRSGLLSTDPVNPADFQSSRLTSRLHQGRLGSYQQAQSLFRRGGHGKVSFSPTADRAGVRTRPVVRRFVSEIASLVGHRLTIGTGTNHSRMTVNGNVSDHWTGHAADIPLVGGALIRAGQDALIAAGMSPRKARRQTGGLYTLYHRGRRIQVIFNTHEGGDHTTHLHVGIR